MRKLLILTHLKSSKKFRTIITADVQEPSHADSEQFFVIFGVCIL